MSATATGDVLDLSLPPRRERTFLGALGALVGAAVLAVAIVFGLLLIGLPIALIVRGIAAAADWVLARLAG